MDTKRVILSIIGMIFVFNGIACDGSCPSYNCGSLDAGKCSSQNKTDISTTYTLQKCLPGQFCPLAQKNADCLANPSPKYYPGSSCSKDSDCTTNTCAKGVCSGTANGANCTTKDECLIGSSCMSNVNATVCQPQLAKGGNCTSDFDCQNAFGCWNSTCTSYFSLADGQNSTDANMCASGFALNGACATLKNANKTDATCNSDADCLYLLPNGSNTTLTGSCVCGYNKEGQKYCNVGSSSDYYKNYVSSAITLLKDTSSCHTAERGSPLCLNKQRTNKAVSYRRTVQSFSNNFIMAHNYPLLVNADTCIKYVAFPTYNDSPIVPDTFQCAKFSCNKTGTNCLHSNNPLNDDGSNVTVSLSKVCNSTQTCYVSPSGVKGIYDQQTVDAQCLNNQDSQAKIARYPGEDCFEDKDCYSGEGFNSTCTNKKCSGYAEKASCNRTLECNAGYFCSNSTCTKQLSENANCTSLYDCANNLFCYNSTCKVFGSLGLGSDVSQSLIGDLDQEPNKNLACEYGYISKFANFSLCGLFDYDNSTKVNVNSDGYVNCTSGSSCGYYDGAATSSKPCDCGYNADGIGYCPLAQTYNQKNWQKAIQTNVKMTKNACHSKSRFNCYKTDKSLLSQQNSDRLNTDKSHLYYKSVDCAKDVLSGSFINLSFVLLAILAFIF